MQKLKERISQLDQENQSLMVHKKNDFDGDNDTNLDVQSLIERILRYTLDFKFSCQNPSAENYQQSIVYTIWVSFET